MIRRLRQSLKIPTSEVAARAGICPRYLRAIETGVPIRSKGRPRPAPRSTVGRVMIAVAETVRDRTLDADALADARLLADAGWRALDEGTDEDIATRTEAIERLRAARGAA